MQQICLVYHVIRRKYPGDKLTQKVAPYCTEAAFFGVFLKAKLKSVKKRDTIKKLHPLFYIKLRLHLPCIFQRNYHYYSEIVEANSSKNLLYELTKLSKKRFIKFVWKSWILPCHFQRVTSIRLHLATNLRSKTSLGAVQFNCPWSSTFIFQLLFS